VERMPEPRSIIAERGIRGMPRERKSNIFAKEITLYVPTKGVIEKDEEIQFSIETF